MAQVYLAHSCEFGIGIVNICHFVYYPCVSVGVRILYRHRLSAFEREDEVLSIKHVQHGENAVALHLGHVSLRLCYCRIEPLHLWRDVGINQFLISAQLCGVITADALQIV